MSTGSKIEEQTRETLAGPRPVECPGYRLHAKLNRTRFGDFYVWVYTRDRRKRIPVSEVGQREERARLQGFQDCEDLVVAWLERKAGAQGTFLFSDRQIAVALRSAALAIKLGQHRTSEDGA